MNIFSSLIEGLKAPFSYPFYTLSKQQEWYLSKQGEKVYKKLNSVALKARFFYGYFLSFREDTFMRESLLHPISLTMAQALELSLLDCNDYKDIFDEHKNPFVAYIKSDEYSNRLDYDVAIAKLISYAHNAPQDYKKLLCLSDNLTNIPFNNLTEADKENRLYKLERLIIWSFRNRELSGNLSANYYNLHGPYKYLTIGEKATRTAK